MLSLFNYINLLMIASAAIAGIMHFRQLDSPSRMICLLVTVALMTESAGRVAAVCYHSNRIIYDIYSLTEFIVLALYFNQLIRVFSTFHVGRILAFVVPFIYIIYYIVIKKQRTLSPGYLQLQHFLVILMSLCLFLQLLLCRRLIALSRDIHFWVASVLLFSHTAAFVNWGIYDYFSDRLKDKVVLINYALLAVSMITYLLLALAFYNIPSKDVTHAGTTTP